MLKRQQISLAVKNIATPIVFAFAKENVFSLLFLEFHQPCVIGVCCGGRLQKLFKKPKEKIQLLEIPSKKIPKGKRVPSVKQSFQKQQTKT